MNNRVSKIKNDVQDRTSVAWQKLCDYVDKVAAENRVEFSPLEALGQNLFFQIHTLPESISKLKNVKRILLYGSKLKRIPPEIGEMESLEYFDPYTSYDLHWFPYEITNCKQLKDSRVSTRALYGNHKNRRTFPRLIHNPVRYFGETVQCSVCRKVMIYEQTNQLWISLWAGTDVLPLLTNLCSKECEYKLPKPPNGYVQFPHKGGLDLKQPLEENHLFAEIVQFEEEHKDEPGKTEEQIQKTIEPGETGENKGFQGLKLIRKIWER